MLFIVDGISRNGPGHDVNRVAPLDQFRPLHESLSLGAAGERVEKADDVADSYLVGYVVSCPWSVVRNSRLYSTPVHPLQPRVADHGQRTAVQAGTCTFLRFLKWG